MKKPNSSKTQGSRWAGDSPLVPTTRQAALLTLLADEDQRMASLVVEQLFASGEAGEEEIEALRRLATGSAAVVLEKSGAQVHRNRWMREMEQRCQQLRSLDDLEEFSWLLARGHNPASPQDEACELIEVWGATVKAAVGPYAPDEEQLAALVRVLGQEEGLTGNVENYYEPDNSFLDTVIFSREGIPISLVVIYMLVGKRAGLNVEGIGMPGHFLARLGGLYFDPFHHGARIDRLKLEKALEEAGMSSPYAVLESMPVALIARRMVFNLVSLYEKRVEAGMVAHYRRILDWLENGLD